MRLNGLTGYDIYGESRRQSLITLDSIQLVSCQIFDCQLQGTFADSSFVSVYNSGILNLSNISLNAHGCYLSGTVELNNSESSNLYNCVDGVPGTGTPIIQVNDCESLGIWNYSGGIKLVNIVSANTNVSFNAPSGRLIVDSTDTAGSIIARGVGSISGTTGGTTITSDDFLNRSVISDSIWDEVTSDHQSVGSTGKALSNAGSAGNPWGSDTASNNDPGTFGELVQNTKQNLVPIPGMIFGA